jgi:hypothetical protein
VIRISFLPYKDDFPSAMVKYELAGGVEKLLDTSFEHFFKKSFQEWNALHSSSDEMRDFFPVMWRILSPRSQMKVMWVIAELALRDETMEKEIVEELEVWSLNGRITKCLGYVHSPKFPLLQVPQYVLVVLKPTDDVVHDIFSND